MNHQYRLIWNDRIQSWIPVEEIAKARGKHSSGTTGSTHTASASSHTGPKKSPTNQLARLALSLALTFSGYGVYANPTGGQVVEGSAAISSSADTVTINQHTDRAIINWQSFSINEGETTRFNQPSADSIALNRITGQDPSRILGNLSANGQVWLVNPNGIYFGPNASIDVSALLATTHDIGNQDFMAGRFDFNIPGKPDASIVNAGNITINDAGLAAFVAPAVRNDGVILAQFGQVEMAAATGFSLDLYGDQLIELAVDPQTLQAYTIDGEALSSFVANNGDIEAATVVLSANAARDVVDNVINVSGNITATTATLDGGDIVLGGDASHGDILVSGTLDASAKNSNAASDGGQVIVYGDNTTIASSAVLKAEGGQAGGDGGFIETSGTTLSIEEGANISTYAHLGTAGEWLIDPVNIRIRRSLAGTISDALEIQDVTITTDGGNTPDTSSGERRGDGDITVQSAISWDNTSTVLTLSAADDIFVNADITGAGVIFLYGQGTADGGSSTYAKDDAANVTSPSIQWRKGSDLDSTRYAIVNGEIYVGGKYIELGMSGVDSSTNIGQFGANSSDPSLFFGRQSGSGIGMVTDEDGFASGEDLRIDYFLPGAPWENYSVAYNGVTQGGSFDNTVPTSFELLPLADDGKMSFKVTSEIGTLNVEQTFSFYANDKFFTNHAVLTNTGTSTLEDVIFVRNFDPDNVPDFGGSYATDNRIVSRTLDGGTANIVSASSLAGDAYYVATGGKPATILYYTTDARALPGTDNDSSLPFWGSDVISMLALAQTQATGTEVLNNDGSIGIIFQLGALGTGASTNLTYQTGLAAGETEEVIVEIDPTYSGGAISWDGGAETSYWFDAANWAGDVLPGSESRVNIGSSYSDLTIYIDADVTVDTLTTYATLSLLTGTSITANEINLNGGSYDVPIFTYTPALNFNLSNGNLNLVNNYSSPGSFTVTGSASGNVNVVNYGATIVPSGGSLVSTGGSVSLTANSPLTVDGTLSASSGVNLTAANPGDLTLNGAVSSTSGEISLAAPGGVVSGTIPEGAIITDAVSNAPVTEQQVEQVALADTTEFEPTTETVLYETADIKETIDEAIVSEPDLSVSAELIYVSTVVDAYPPADDTSGIPLPQINDIGLEEAIVQLVDQSYTPEDRVLFYDSLTQEQVVSSLLAEGETELAAFFETTAQTGLTTESELIALLEESGVSEEQRVAYLGVFVRMRELAMDKLLKPAVDKLRANPSIADVIDEGKSGGSIDLDIAGQTIEAQDGIALLKGKVKSDSKLLTMRVNGRWSYIDENGNYEAKVPVKKGESKIQIEIFDPSGKVSKSEVTVHSDVEGKLIEERGRRIAIMIGVEEYDDAIPELDTPVNDAQTVSSLMAEKQGFEIKALTNPTKQEIIDALSSVSKNLKQEDSLMVYYAGHGYLLEETGRGYWLPRDASPTDPENWVSNRDVARLFHRTPAKQIFMVSDSCYSGAFTGDALGEDLQDQTFIRLRAVMGLSSGGEQPVWDGGGDGHSIFASKLINAIPSDEMQGLPLYKQVKAEVVKASPQVPGYGAMILPGYDKGADFELR